MGRSLDPAVELAGFDRRLARLREHPGYAATDAPPAIDLTELIERWTASSGDITRFTRREIRAMCWSTALASDRKFIAVISANPQFSNSIRLLRGLWFAHERKWRLPTSFEIETLITSYKLSRGPRPKWIRTVLATHGVLGAEAPNALAAAARVNLRDAKKILEDHAISSDGVLGNRALEAMVEQWIRSSIEARTVHDRIEIFDAGREGILSDPQFPKDLFAQVVEHFVGAVAKSGEPYRQRIADWIVTDERLGHPARRRTRGNWAGISERTRQLAVQLFAARDLGAFFQVLIGTRDDVQHRRRFWEKYVESPQLINFAIASDPNDRKKLIASLGKDRAYVAQLLDAPSDHSAFLMQFRTREYDIVVAEMSKANNSMYIYNTAAFEEHVGELQDSHFTFRQLKSMTVSFDQKRHVGEWHDRFAHFLAYYGIYAR